MIPLIYHYTSMEAVRDLCEKLHLPEEVTSRVLTYSATLDYKPFEEAFAGLFSMETGLDSVHTISALCQTDDDPTGDSGLKALTIYLMAAQHTRGMYQELGIPDEIFYDTMGCYNRYVREHKASYGDYGFDRDFWIFRHHAGVIFRLGLLEFEMLTLHKEAEPVGQARGGDRVLSVHIPSDRALRREDLEASYRMARAFFAEYFPDYDYQCVYCSTWLLSPVLKEILAPESGILTFQSHYEITQVNPKANSAVIWIFKREYEDYRDLPEDTSLMRGIKQVLLAGGSIGSAAGYVKDFDMM